MAPFSKSQNSKRRKSSLINLPKWHTNSFKAPSSACLFCPLISTFLVDSVEHLWGRFFCPSNIHGNLWYDLSSENTTLWHFADIWWGLLQMTRLGPCCPSSCLYVAYSYIVHPWLLLPMWTWLSMKWDLCWISIALDTNSLRWSLWPFIIDRIDSKVYLILPFMYIFTWIMFKT